VKIELSRERKILLISVLVSSFFISLGLLTNLGVLSISIFLSAFIISAPQLLLRYKKFRELKEMEEKFPDFLRDITESIRAGMPLHRAIVSASELDYGILSKEIKRASNRISWGTPVDKVLDQFAERVKKSKRLHSSIKIIKESHTSGGDVPSILESVADSTTMLEDSEKEKRSLLSQYTVLMYAISLIFIVIVVAINRLLVPIFQRPSAGEFMVMENPCAYCSGITCNLCSVFRSTSEHFFSIEDPTSIGSYYTSLFFFMAMVQSIFCGLVAGQIGENSIIAGTKHSLILLTITIGAFFLLVEFGLMGV
jgi:flagellar protein FlaJ